MAIYAKYNNTPKSEENRYTEPENCMDSVVNESIELLEAVEEFQVKDILLEGSDVVHAIIKYFVITYLPQQVFTNPLCWVPVFFIVPLATIKLAKRYKQFGCIRNHANPNNCSHTCDRRSGPLDRRSSPLDKTK
jgi:hypothetical protein